MAAYLGVRLGVSNLRSVLSLRNGSQELKANCAKSQISNTDGPNHVKLT